MTEDIYVKRLPVIPNGHYIHPQYMIALVTKVPGRGIHVYGNQHDCYYCEVESLNSWFPYRVARVLGEFLLERDPHLVDEGWMRESPTGREVDYHDTTVQEADL